MRKVGHPRVAGGRQLEELTDVRRRQVAEELQQAAHLALPPAAERREVLAASPAKRLT